MTDAFIEMNYKVKFIPGGNSTTGSEFPPEMNLALTFFHNLFKFLHF